jgi:GNAT superfamily N-acetyltransferase
MEGHQALTPPALEGGVSRTPSPSCRWSAKMWAVIPAIETAHTEDLEILGDVLQRAFWDDPVMEWILRDESSRSSRLTRMFKIVLRGHYLPLDTVWTTTDRLGAALWAPPGHALLPARTLLRQAPGMVRAMGRDTVRGLRALSQVERLHPKEPHWYLGVLGTSPAHQGKGIGSALLAPGLEFCDKESLPCYLESSKESNIAFYRRHGFEVTGKLQLPFGGPPVWPMWREPLFPRAL